MELDRVAVLIFPSGDVAVLSQQQPGQLNFFDHGTPAYKLVGQVRKNLGNLHDKHKPLHGWRPVGIVRDDGVSPLSTLL